MSIPKISQLSHLLPGISHIRVRVFALLIVVTQACILGANNARMNDECNRNEIKLKYSIQLPTAGRHRLEAGGSCASAHFRSILLDLFIKTSGWQRQRIAAEQIRAAHWQRSLSLSLSGRHKQRALKQIYLAAVESKFSWLRLAFDCCLHAQQLPPGVVCVSLCVCLCICVSRLVSLDLCCSQSLLALSSWSIGGAFNRFKVKSDSGNWIMAEAAKAPQWPRSIGALQSGISPCITQKVCHINI